MPNTFKPMTNEDFLLLAFFFVLFLLMLSGGKSERQLRDEANELPPFNKKYSDKYYNDKFKK